MSLIRIFRLVLLLLLVSVAIMGDDSNPYVAFIGEPISARQSSRSCTDFLPRTAPGEIDPICLDGVIEIEYKIRRLFVGAPANPVLIFDLYHYRGLPPHLTNPRPFVLAESHEGHLVHVYSAYVVEDESDPFVCGMHLIPGEKVPSPKAPRAIVEEFPDCTHGLSLADLIARVAA
jgi:hypothetical protein